MKTRKIIKGLSIHCHHDRLIEYCYDYDKRVKYIKTGKPKNEIETRLKLFKMLSKEAINALPKRLIKANAERDKAYAEWDKASAEWEKAYAELNKAYAEWHFKESWHKKYCGCKEWNGSKIIFDK